MEETGLSCDETEKMRILIDSKDFLGIEELVNKHDIRPDLKELILSLPGLFGSTDVLDKAMSITVNERSQNALNNLRQVLEILHDYDFDKYVSVDLGMIQSIDYYTGIIFKGFTYGAGFPVLRGGRYDSLTQLFGRNCPATGFSIGINMVMMALERQKITSASISTDSLICYEEKGRKAAFMISTALREQGLCVETDTTLGSLESLRDYAAKRGIGGIIRVIDPENIELHNLKTGSIEKTGITSLINNGFGR
ncbi:MAG TPA: ATP phosphoribosyltransferase regulatory subunit, partial [Clostridia bacterium]